MPTKDNGYGVIIERGYTSANDSIVDFLKTRVSGPYLDVGCNTGWLLREVPHGVGVDASLLLLKRARSLGSVVVFGVAEALPFADFQFDVVVLSCVLQQCPDVYLVLDEALRVSRHRVIGITPYAHSRWGSVSVGRSPWVKSVVDVRELGHKYKVVAMSAVPRVLDHCFFEIWK